MAGFGLGNYINPAVGGFIDQRRNALAGLGAGLLQGRPGSGVQEGIQADTAYAVMQKAEDERLKQINQTQQWLQANYPQYANLPADQGWQAAMADMAAKRNSTSADATNSYEGRLRIGQEQGLTGTDLTTYALTGSLPSGRGGSGELSLTPTWMRDPSGNLVPGQIDKSGNMNVTAIPEGYSVVDPFALTGGKASVTVDAKTQASARAALPGAQQALAITENAINLIRNDTAGLDEQFGNTMGIPNRNLPTIPGVFQQAKGNWQANFSQAKGQQFMQAREMLKGGGPITDYEGMKGEAAFSRMEQAAAIGDKDTFLRALADFEAAVRDGYAKLVATANGEYSAGGSGVPATPAGATNVDDLLKKYQ